MTGDTTNPIQIKVGRDIITLKQGDYFMDNQACIQLVSGDGRSLAGRGYDRTDHVKISAKAWKELKNGEGMAHTKKKFSLGSVCDIYTPHIS